MTKAELANMIAKDTGLTKKAATDFINALIKAAIDGLARDGRLSFGDLGDFHLEEKPAKQKKSGPAQTARDVVFTLNDDQAFESEVQEETATASPEEPAIEPASAPAARGAGLATANRTWWDIYWL